MNLIFVTSLLSMQQ